VPTAPAKTGWRFTGWTPEVQDVTADATYRATYAINQYTLTFVLGNGQDDVVITQNYNTAVVAPTNLEKLGYTFSEWFPSAPSTMPAEDKTITAQWTANSYSVSFDKDDEQAA
jgi:hypothetical protein